MLRIYNSHLNVPHIIFCTHPWLSLIIYIIYVIIYNHAKCHYSGREIKAVCALKVRSHFVKVGRYN